MTSETRTINVLEDAQDILPLYRAETEGEREDVFVYAAKPSLDAQKYFFDLSVSNPEDREIPVFSEHWGFDKEKGITGSGTYLTLRFDKLALRSNGLWVPGLPEGRELDRQGKLENGVYRDYGVALFNRDIPNQRHAGFIAQQTQEKELELLVVSKSRRNNLWKRSSRGS